MSRAHKSVLEAAIAELDWGTDLGRLGAAAARLRAVDPASLVLVALDRRMRSLREARERHLELGVPRPDRACAARRADDACP